MKKVLCLFIALLTFACTNNAIMDTPNSLENKMKSNSEIRSYTEALEIAKSAISMLDQTSMTRGYTNERKINLREHLVYKRDIKTRSDQNANDTLIYIFNFENNEGFALVSANKKTEGLLAISEKGNCNPNIRSDVEGFNMFIDMAKKYVSTSSKEIVGRFEPNNFLLDTVVHVISSVGPLVSVKWGQTYPEGEYCPNGISGCANTAIAQIMSYYNQPTGISLTYNGADINYQNLNWTSLKNHNTNNPSHNHLSSSCNDLDAHNAIGRLLRQLGHMNNSEYDDLGTGTYTEQYAPSTMTSLGYHVRTFEDFSGYNARKQIDSLHICLMRGSGHAWIMDGYKRDIATEYCMERVVGPNGIITWVVREVYGTVTYYYNHINWGWYGNCDGYYSENVFNTSSVLWPDTNTNTASFNATSVRYAGVFY